MFNPNILTFIAILLFGLWTSYTDLKKGVIKNYSIALLILSAIILNVFFTKSFVNYPIQSGINILIALIGGFLIWLAGLWSAADAKLFTAFNFLMPITFFPHPMSYFPGIIIMANSFVPLFIFSFIFILIKTSAKEKKGVIANVIKPKFIFSILVTLLALMSIFYEISNIFKISMDYFSTTIILFSILWLVENKFNIKLNYFYIIVSILSIVFFYKILFTLSFLINWMISFFTVLIIYSLIYLSGSVYTESVKLTELKKGMIPAEIIIIKNGKYIKKRMNFIGLLSMLREKSSSKAIFEYNSEGISQKDLKKIKCLYKSGKIDFDEIKICKTTHFAPFLFLGVLLTYFTGGRYFIYLFS
jgi:hypothetical protein